MTVRSMNHRRSLKNLDDNRTIPERINCAPNDRIASLFSRFVEFETEFGSCRAATCRGCGAGGAIRPMSRGDMPCAKTDGDLAKRSLGEHGDENSGRTETPTLSVEIESCSSLFLSSRSGCALALAYQQRRLWPSAERQRSGARETAERPSMTKATAGLGYPACMDPDEQELPAQRIQGTSRPFKDRSVRSNGYALRTEDLT